MSEIGAGTGTATRRWHDSGADHLVTVEPDERMVDFLRAETSWMDRSPWPLRRWEVTALPEVSFDLGILRSLP